MKKLLTITFLLPFVVSAQTKTDYNLVMDKFVRYFNAQQTDSICTLFPDKSQEHSFACFWDFSKPERLYKEYGTIKSFQYLGKEKDVRVYKLIFEDRSHAMSFSLNTSLQFETFRFDTSSDKIEKMMREAK